MRHVRSLCRHPRLRRPHRAQANLRFFLSSCTLRRALFHLSSKQAVAGLPYVYKVCHMCLSPRAHAYVCNARGTRYVVSMFPALFHCICSILIHDQALYGADSGITFWNFSHANSYVQLYVSRCVSIVYVCVHIQHDSQCYQIDPCLFAE